MDLGRVDAEAEAAEPLVLVAFAHVDRVGLRVRVDDEDRLRMTAHTEALALADRVELRPFVQADDGAVGMGLEAGFLDMFLAAAVGLVLEMDFVMEGRGEPQELFVRERCGFVQVEGALAQGLAVRSQDLSSGA